MWSIHARPRALGRLVTSATQLRYAHVLKKEHFVAEGDVARRLEDTHVWRPLKAKREKPKIRGEKTRINIVSEELCSTCAHGRLHPAVCGLEG